MTTDTGTYIAPIPTEYSGVLFRSKSEAIFARCLDLHPGNFIWEYEPERWRTSGGWTPDFWIIGRSGPHKIYSAVIEYKPSEVTDAYLNQLAGRFESLGDRIATHYQIVACGNSFEGQPKTLLGVESRWIDIENTLQLFGHIKEASRYRFDLKH